MSRYVDVGELKENICKRVNNPAIRGWLNKLIDDTPTADVVEVVRCKDCKYAFHHPLGYIYCHRDGINAYEMVFRKDSFCSYGERKDKED